MEHLPAKIATLLKNEIERNLDSGDFDKIFNNIGLERILTALHDLSNIPPTPTSGSHLGYVREYIQCKCVNGERVTWGSHDILKFRNELTVSDMEHLAQAVVRAALHDVFSAFTADVTKVVKTPVDLVDAIQLNKNAQVIKYIADHLVQYYPDSPYKVLDTVTTRTRVGQEICAIVETRKLEPSASFSYYDYSLFSARHGLIGWQDGSDFLRKESTTLVDLYCIYRDRISKTEV